MKLQQAEAINIIHFRLEVYHECQTVYYTLNPFQNTFYLIKNQGPIYLDSTNSKPQVPMEWPTNKMKQNGGEGVW
jgi:hypothetical protein